MLSEKSRKLSVTLRETDIFQKLHFAFIFHFPTSLVVLNFNLFTGVLTHS